MFIVFNYKPVTLCFRFNLSTLNRILDFDLSDDNVITYFLFVCNHVIIKDDL